MLQYIIFSILIILGLLLVLLQEKLGNQHWAYPYLSEIASAVLVGGTLSLLFKIFVDRDANRRLAQMFKIHDSVLKSGLKEIYLDSKSYNFTGLIENSKELTIVLNDGLRWVGNYSVELGKRFSEKTITEFFCVGETSKFVDVLAIKVGTEPQVLQEKLRQSVRLIKETFEGSEKKGQVLIYAMKNFPTHSVFRGEETVVITPYQISSGRRAVPLYVFEREEGDSIAADVIGDLEHLRQESTIIYNSGQTAQAP